MNDSTPLLLAGLVGLCVWGMAAEASGYKYINERRCPNGAAWGQRDLPVEYQINRRGSADIRSFRQLKNTIQASFRAWIKPCCSSFDAKYLGKTRATALDGRRQRRGNVVLSWREQSWPRQLGDPRRTIAVTRPRFRGCTIVDATMLYNGAGHRFSLSGQSRRVVDLQSVATHEIGHLLGLGHTQVRDATMFGQYGSGTKERTLVQDDIKGVCSLYGGGTCGGCRRDADCPGAQECIQGTCKKTGCNSNADCAGVKECNTLTGQCQVPTCRTAAGCPNDYECSSGECVPECLTCRSCNRNSECGSRGQCADVNGGKCIIQCGPNADCPGDSQCFRVQGDRQTYRLCLNPGANSTGVCPNSYTCSTPDPPPTRDAGATPDPGRDAGPPGPKRDTNTGGGSEDGGGLLFPPAPDTTSGSSPSSDAGSGTTRDTATSPGRADPAPPNSGGEAPCEGVTCSGNATCQNGRCVTNRSRDATSDLGSTSGGARSGSGTYTPPQTQASSCAATSRRAPSELPLGLLAVLGCVAAARGRRRDT